MGRRRIVYALALLPTLMGADGDHGQVIGKLVVTSLPDCAEGELLTYRTDGLGCAAPPSPPPALPDCQTSGQLLTYTGSGGSGAYGCTGKGSASLELTDIAVINSTFQQLINLDVAVRAIEQRTTPSVASKYCGRTANQPSADFLDGTATGIAAAASLCAKVPACGTGARMCTVYEMYHSVASGVITDAQDLSKSWVYMASWSQEYSDNSGLAKEPGAGLADNCGGYTVADSAKKWFGTAVEWTTADSGKKALKFFSGPPNIGIPGTTATVPNPGTVSCASVLPIACCQ